MDRSKVFDAIRERVPQNRLSQTQVERINAILDGIELRGLLRNEAAYVLATAQHESDYFRAMEEYASGKAYEGRKDLGNTVAGDGAKFKGRGFVMITGRRNYTDWSKRLGVDFLKEPEWVSKLEYAVPILIDGMQKGTFTGKRLSDYITLEKSDFRNARRIVNGVDRAAHIAKIATAYDEALKAAGYGENPPNACTA